MTLALVNGWIESRQFRINLDWRWRNDFSTFLRNCSSCLILYFRLAFGELWSPQIVIQTTSLFLINIPSIDETKSFTKFGIGNEQWAALARHKRVHAATNQRRWINLSSDDKYSCSGFGGRRLLNNNFPRTAANSLINFSVFRGFYGWVTVKYRNSLWHPPPHFSASAWRRETNPHESAQMCRIMSGKEGWWEKAGKVEGK